MLDQPDRRLRSVLVLGASGFIGSRLVTALSANPAYRPVAASRRGPMRVDATDAASVWAALRDVDYVVNCIAGNSRTMTAATQILCNAARANPPKRIIHLSSMAVYGAATGVVSEAQAPVAPVSGYGQAKIACEQIVRKYVHDGGDAVILRPTCVFGPGSPQWTIRIGQLLKARRLGDLGVAGDGCCNLSFIDDLVAGIIHALDAPDISGRRFNISSSSALTWNEFLLRFGIALGATPVRRIPPRSLKLEAKLLAPALRLAALTVGRVGIRVNETITPGLLALLRQDIRIDSSAAVAALALPRTPTDRMIALASRWRAGTGRNAVGRNGTGPDGTGVRGTGVRGTGLSGTGLGGIGLGGTEFAATGFDAAGPDAAGPDAAGLAATALDDSRPHGSRRLTDPMNRLQAAS